MVIIEETWRTRSWLASRTKSNGEGEQSSKASGNRDESSSEKRNDIPCRYKKWKNPWCKFLHPPVSKLQVWDWMQIWKNMFLQTCWGWGENPARSQRAVVRTDPLHYWRSLHNWVVYLKILNREKSILRENGKLGPKRAVKFSKGTCHQRKIRDRNGPVQGVIPKCEPHELFARRNTGKITWGDLASRKIRPQSGIGFGEKYLHAQECGQSYLLYFQWRHGFASTSLQNLQKNENS